MLRTALCIGLIAVGAVSAAAQDAPPAPAGTVNVEADPIRCWWRTSTNAVRVGEPFSLILTCAIVDNETTTIVPDQSRLDPAAVQLPPFEVIGGQREPDIRGDQRRFFQYQYKLRLINEELFGRDVHIPSVQVSYHIESKMARGESVRGRDRIYILPSESIRVLSLVPADATDIRDAPSWTFGDIEAQRFRARVYRMVAAVLFTAAGLVIVMALVRYLRSRRQPSIVGRRIISDQAILGGVARELAAVRRATQRGEWSPELAGRAVAAFRIAGTIALGRAVSQAAARQTGNGHEGQLAVRGGLLWTKRALVSGSATPDAIARELSRGAGSAGHRHALESLQTALGRFTAALFGREPRLDETALSESLAEAPAILRRLRLENLWIVRKLRSLTHTGGEVGTRAWSR